MQVTLIDSLCFAEMCHSIIDPVELIKSESAPLQDKCGTD